MHTVHLSQQLTNLLNNHYKTILQLNKEDVITGQIYIFDILYVASIQKCITFRHLHDERNVVPNTADICT